MSLSCGAATLSVVLAISSIILVVTVAGVIISTILTNAAFSERLASDALFSARAGAQDAIMRIIRYKNCSPDGCPYDYSITIDNGTAQVNIRDSGSWYGCEAVPAGLCVISTGSAALRKKRIVVKTVADAITGELKIQSFKEVPL
ncbi:MAG: hypothetical protein A3B23_03610 [Candidatus Colwellbacteria bacterium RIFCSPLOWO2_01_FULL_48_10]|uniref:Type 4 fimbrial biogenesis protein PilX N-terminal domain-containing protein n=1 Tax=Candidatus Colwellbacteria bacterium RIFCSPLOWO2_01_FULL_48_10 TaxID=1797690 RepID=A0A1G1Z554_9BACT|nr:MAG: hypothetical protein A3B23_03610 [Candidatus Colwellbacteria bacterium RIFCSPLOWO2_01_FULL_48_10]